MSYPLWTEILLFVLAASVICMGGVRLAKYADRFADASGLGEAVIGAGLLGFLTALPGIAASVTASIDGRPSLAISNAMGGIAVQTVALAFADISYKRANLEHAAASLPNMMQTVLLIFLLTLVSLTLTGPEFMIGHIHIMTLLLFAAAGVCFYLIYKSRLRPMWIPEDTQETIQDTPVEADTDKPLRPLVIGFLIAGFFTLAGGIAATKFAGSIAFKTGASDTLMGGLVLAFATSLPEIVTSVAAVRRGALTLAVGGVVGGNIFDVLFVCVADLTYLPGSIYHAVPVAGGEIFVTNLTILLNVILLGGLIYRQEHGPGNIGVESVGMLVAWTAGMILLLIYM